MPSPNSTAERPNRATPDARAAQLLRTSGVTAAPVPVESVALGLGLPVERAELGDDVSGILVVEDGRGVIGVNAAHSRVRQRFSIAHEVGHYVLHRDEAPLFIDKRYIAYRDGRSATGADRREREANAFAAALLMPAALVRAAVDRYRFDLADEDALDALASLFEVSRQAMAVRVSYLRLFAGPETRPAV